MIRFCFYPSELKRLFLSLSSEWRSFLPSHLDWPSRELVISGRKLFLRSYAVMLKQKSFKQWQVSCYMYVYSNNKLMWNLFPVENTHGCLRLMYWTADNAFSNDCSHINMGNWFMHNSAELNILFLLSSFVYRVYFWLWLDVSFIHWLMQKICALRNAEISNAPISRYCAWSVSRAWISIDRQSNVQTPHHFIQTLKNENETTKKRF